MTLQGRLNDGQRDEYEPSTLESCVGSEPLKDLREDDRNDRQVFLGFKGSVKALHMRTPDSVEKVDPGIGVDDDHVRVVRADRQVSTSPSHATFPRSRRTAR